MANILNGLMPTLYTALDIVSREMVGFIPSVAVNAAPTTAAKGETISVPVTPTAVTHDIVPGQLPADDGDQNIDRVDMTIQKSKYASVRWSGEEQLGVSNAGTYNAILVQQFTQAMRAIANEVDADCAATFIGASRAYGTPGTVPFANGIEDVAQVRKILADNGAPLTDLQLVVNTSAGAKLRSNTLLAAANSAGSDATLRRGVLLDVNGFAIRESAGIVTHTPGSITGSALVNKADGYAKGDTAIAVDGATAIALKAGDFVSFGNDAEKYIVGANASGSPIKLNAPGLVHGVADNTAVTVASARYAANMAFDRNAIQLITRAPAMPVGGDSSEDVTVITDPASGISFQVAVYREYRRVRFEIGLAWGVKLIKPEHVAVLLG